MSKLARLTREFHERFGLPINDLSRALLLFRAELIREEMTEAAEAVEELHATVTALEDQGYAPPSAAYARDICRAFVAKELADAVIALYGTALTVGIDLDEAVRLVHASNMSKLAADGKPIVRDDGKVMKGPNYREPDMSSALVDLP